MRRMFHKSNQQVQKPLDSHKVAFFFPRQTKKAFTLIEMLIATAILLLALGAILMAVVSCIVMNESNNNMVIAANDAAYVSEQIKGLAYTGIAGYTAPAFTNLPGETITLNRDIGLQIAEVTVNVDWTERGRSRNFQLSTRIAK